jgi:hypothetical protein
VRDEAIVGERRRGETRGGEAKRGVAEAERCDHGHGMRLENVQRGRISPIACFVCVYFSDCSYYLHPLTIMVGKSREYNGMIIQASRNDRIIVNSPARREQGSDLLAGFASCCQLLLAEGLFEKLNSHNISSLSIKMDDIINSFYFSQILILMLFKFRIRFNLGFCELFRNVRNKTGKSI